MSPLSKQLCYDVGRAASEDRHDSYLHYASTFTPRNMRENVSPLPVWGMCGHNEGQHRRPNPYLPSVMLGLLAYGFVEGEDQVPAFGDAVGP